jgi:hypothetical protein
LLQANKDSLETAVQPVDVRGKLGLERGKVGGLVLDAAVAGFVEHEPVIAIVTEITDSQNGGAVADHLLRFMVRGRVAGHPIRRADRAPGRCRAGAASAWRRNAPADFSNPD